MDPYDAQPDDPVADLVRMGKAKAGGERLGWIRRCSGRGCARSGCSRGLSLRELARRLELSPSSISQIETGKMQPSVRTLYAFVSEFGVTVDEVLFDQAPPSQDGASRGGVRGVPAAAGPGLAVQRAEGRPAIPLNSGVHWERLMFWADEDVEFMEATYEPGGASGPDDALVRHSGHEFGYVLSGTLRVVVGFDEFVLGPGDSITFPSSTPHRLSNEGTETVRAIWVVRGRRGANSARRGVLGGLALRRRAARTMSGRALVVGVTGISGGNLAQRLLADGWEVAGLCRRPDGLDERITPLTRGSRGRRRGLRGRARHGADARLLHDLVASRDRGRELRRQRAHAAEPARRDRQPRSPCATSRSSPG